MIHQNSNAPKQEPDTSTVHNQTGLFNAIDKEHGLRKLITRVIKLAEVDKIVFFREDPNQIDDQMIEKYSLFVASLFPSQKTSTSLKEMLVLPEDFGSLLNLFRAACSQIDMSIESTSALTDFLECKKS